MIKRKEKMSRFDRGFICGRLSCEFVTRLKMIEVVNDLADRRNIEGGDIHKKDYSYVDIAIAKKNLCQELLDLISVEEDILDNFDPDKRLGN